MTSRFLLIGLSAEGLHELRTALDLTQKGGKKKAVGKGGRKTRNRLIELLDANPHLSRDGLSAALGICPSAIQKH